LDKVNPLAPITNPVNLSGVLFYFFLGNDATLQNKKPAVNQKRAPGKIDEGNYGLPEIR